METGIIPEWIKEHPVSFVQWIAVENISANDYNPNSVAPPEMDLLELSIKNDKYTQPIVVWEVEPGKFEVIDGFHRFRIGVERMNMSHLPCVVVNRNRTDKGDRMMWTNWLMERMEPWLDQTLPSFLSRMRHFRWISKMNTTTLHPRTVFQSRYRCR